MSVISSVLSFCFDILTKCFTFLSSVEIIESVSVFNFCLAIIIVATVMFGLLSVVRVLAGNSVRSKARKSK